MAETAQEHAIEIPNPHSQSLEEKQITIKYKILDGSQDLTVTNMPSRLRKNWKLRGHMSPSHDRISEHQKHLGGQEQRHSNIHSLWFSRKEKMLPNRLQYWHLRRTSGKTARQAEETGLPEVKKLSSPSNKIGIRLTIACMAALTIHSETWPRAMFLLKWPVVKKGALGTGARPGLSQRRGREVRREAQGGASSRRLRTRLNFSESTSLPSERRVSPGRDQPTAPVPPRGPPPGRGSPDQLPHGLRRAAPRGRARLSPRFWAPASRRRAQHPRHGDRLGLRSEACASVPRRGRRRLRGQGGAARSG
eukprot:bmy_20412T0